MAPSPPPPAPRPARLIAASLRGLLVAAAAAAGVLSGVVGWLGPGPVRDRAVALALTALDGAIAGRLDVERLDGPLGGRLTVRGVRVVTPTGALALSVTRISTRVAYLDLLTSRVTLREAELTGLELPLLDAAGDVPVAAAFAPTDISPTSAPSPWSVTLDAASIRGGVVSWAGDAPDAAALRQLHDVTLTTSFRQSRDGLMWSHTLLAAELGGRQLTVSTAGGLSGGALTLDPLDATWGPHSLRAHVRLPDLAAGAVDLRLDGLAVDLYDALALTAGAAATGPRPRAHGPDVLTLTGTIQGRWATAPGSLRADVTARGGPVGELHVAGAVGAAGPTVALSLDARDLDLSRLPARWLLAPEAGAALPTRPALPLGATSLRAHIRGTGRPGAPGASWDGQVELTGLFGPAGALPPRLVVTGALDGARFQAAVDAPGALEVRAGGDLQAGDATASVQATDLDAGPALALLDRLAGGDLGAHLTGVRGRLASLDGGARLTGLAGTSPLQLDFSSWLSISDAALPRAGGAAPEPGPAVVASAVRGSVRGSWPGPGGLPDLDVELEVVGGHTPWGGATRVELQGALAGSSAPCGDARGDRRHGLTLRGRLSSWGAWGGGGQRAERAPAPSRPAPPVAARRLALRGVALDLCPDDWRVTGQARVSASGIVLAGRDRLGRVAGTLRASRRPGALLGLHAAAEVDAAVLGGALLPHLEARYDGTLGARGQLRGELLAQARAPRVGELRWRQVDVRARLSPRGAGRLGLEGAVRGAGLRVGAGDDVAARSTQADVSLVVGGRGLGVEGGGTWHVTDARSWGRAHPSLKGAFTLDADGAATLTGQGGVLRQLRASARLPTAGRPGLELRLDTLRLEEARTGFLVTARRLRLGAAGGLELDGLRVERLRGDGALSVSARLPARRGRLRVELQASALRPGPWWARLRGLIGLPPTPRLPADGELEGTIRLAGTRASVTGSVDLALRRARVGGITGLGGTLRATLTPGARPRRRAAAGRAPQPPPVGRLTLNAALRQEGGGAVTLEDLSLPLGVSLQPPWVRLGDAFESAGRVVLDDVELEPLGLRVGGVDGASETSAAGPQGHARGRPIVGRVRGQLLLAPSPSRQLSVELEARGLGVGSYTGRTATLLATLEPDRTSMGLSLSWPDAPHGVRRGALRAPGGETGSGAAPEGEGRGLLEVRAAVDAGVEPVLRGDMSWEQLAQAVRRAGLGGAVELRRVGVEAIPAPVAGLAGGASLADLARAHADGALTLQGTVEAPIVAGALRVAGVEVGGGTWAVDVHAEPTRAHGAAGGERVNRLALRVTGAMRAGAPPRTLLEGSVRLPHVLRAIFSGRPAEEALARDQALRVVARLNPLPNALWVPCALGGRRARDVLDTLDLLVPGGALGGRMAVTGGEAGPAVTVTAHAERRRGARTGASLGPEGGEEARVGLTRSMDVVARLGADGLVAGVTLDQLAAEGRGRRRGGGLGFTVSAPVPASALLGEGGLARLREATYAVRVRADRFALDPLTRVFPSVFDVARGALDGALEVEASRAGWAGTGRLVARFEEVRVAPLGLAQRDVELALSLRPGALELAPLELVEEGSRRGRMELAARAALGEPAGWDAAAMPLSGRLVLDRFPLLARKDLAARLDGAMDIGGTLARPRLLGRVAVTRARISPRLGEADLQPIELPQDVRFVAEGDEAGARGARPAEHVTAAALVGRLPIDLDLDVTLPKHVVRVTHPFLDVRPWGKLRAVARGGPLRLTGRVWLDDGAVTLYEQRFVLTDQSYIDFTGNPATDPELHLAATYDISEVDLSAIGEETTEGSKITVRLGGTAANPGAPELSSDPPMDESQIVSVIVLGSPVAGGGSGAASAERLSQVLMGALGLTSRLERELTFVDSLSLSAGTEALHLAVGKRVGASLWFYYTLNLGAPEGENVHEARMEYRFGKRLRLGTRFGDARKGSLDLLYRWRY